MTATQRQLAELVQTLAPALRTRPIAPKRYSRAQKRDLSAALRWNRDRNIVGFGVGPKCTNNVPDYGRHSLVVFVVKKLAKWRLPKDRLIPRRLRPASARQGVVTDVIEVGSIPMLQAGLCPGANAAHFTMRSGSVTAVVETRSAPSTSLLLSCCHVFAPAQVLGEPVESPPDPSSITFNNHVADVDAFEPLQSGGNIANFIDAAVAQPIAGAPPLSNTIDGVGRITSASALLSGQFLPNGIRDVFGVGATTGVVNGEIIAEGVATLLTDPAGQLYLFRDLVAYRPNPVTQAGDSGMPILRGTPGGLELLGMHIGFGRIATTTIGAAFFVPIAPVLDRFGVDVAI